jgi:uncharacterized protein (DUF2235 family)
MTEEATRPNLPQPKNIVLLFDGTSQDDSPRRRDSWTNVVRIRDQIDTVTAERANDQRRETIWWYSTGVGALDNTFRESANPEKAQNYTATTWLARVEQLIYGYGTMERVQQACE